MKREQPAYTGCLSDQINEAISLMASVEAR